MNQLSIKLFLWLGRKLFRNFTAWGKSPDQIEVMTFSNIENWERKYQRSKKFMGIRTPSRAS